MTHEARMEQGEHGLVPQDDGWFVVNLVEAEWHASARFGRWCAFEGPVRFPELGVNVHLLEPGQAACMYHRENQQEAFLVLSGECLLLVEEEERPLRAWDFFHCPPGTTHVFVGAGAGPCAILMMGVRRKDERITYPASELARRHAAGVSEATDSPARAYSGSPPRRPIPAPWPLA